MDDYKIVIDAGHGGDDPGASGNNIIEKDLNLAISDYMYDRFRELGVPVKMTRTTDETVSPTERVNRVLNAFGNSDDVLVISNHINAGGGEGAEVIYALRNNSVLSNLILDEIAKEGQKIRKAYQRRLPSNTSKDYYFMQRNTGITQPVTVEYGFLDNTADAAKLKANYLQYAEAVVRAVLNYIGYGDTTDNLYTVSKGDSLWSIAKKFDISVEELKAANSLTSNLLNIGQQLVIPTEEEQPVPGEYTIYIVKSGDTLYGIANQYDIDVNDLIEYNNLSGSSLSIGQQLFIPAPQEESEYDTYAVKSGDTLYQIANRYGTSVTELMNINNLSTNILTLGQRLLIPKTTNGTPSNNEITYVVKSGDNLYDIANKYGISVNELKNYNNLTSNLLSIGQTLRIPTASEGVTYVVKSGDNLYSIANQYGTTVDEIKRKNNLTSNLLNIGQILII